MPSAAIAPTGMQDYTPAARITWFALFLAGASALAFALADLASRPIDVQSRIVFAAAVGALAGAFPARVPGTRISIGGGDIFVFLAFLLYGVSAGMVVATVESAVTALRTSKRWTSWLMSVEPAVAMAIASYGADLVLARLSPPVPFSVTLAVLLAMVLVYGWLTVVLVHLLPALKARAAVTPLRWIRSYAWFSIAQLACASVAGLLYISETHFGLEAIVVAAPLVAMFLGGLHFHFEKRNADERHVLELMDRERRLQDALQAAEHASRAKTRFLAAASHDLRQPLHALSFLTAALDMRPLDAGSRDIMGKVSNALEDLSGELDALLDISKLDAGLVPVNASVFELEPFLKRIAGPFVAVAQSSGVVLEVGGDAGVHVLTDRALLERIVRNLLDNAFKYTPRGSVSIGCRAHGGVCTVQVKDTGIGIPEREIEHVFEEFYQVGNVERDRHKGMGLGLSIVRRLAHLLGVDISINSREGFGTTFRLELATVAPPPAPVPKAPPPASSLVGCQVLLIDDEAAPRDALRGYLEGLGCSVSVAATLAEAGAVAMLDEPDIVLADLRLRDGETGIEAISRLRQSRPELAALIITGDTAPERLAELESAGIEVMHKPVAAARLVESMTRLLARRREPAL